MKKALKEKLVKLIHYCTSCEECRDEDIADHLIANGVVTGDKIKELEEEEYKRARRRGGEKRQLVFFSGGN